MPQSIEASGEVRAGVAQASFALPKGVPLAGYSHRKGRPSLGLHDPVGVRALIVQDDDTITALVSCDLLIIDEHLFAAVRQRLMSKGLPQELVLFLAATHTHSGPGAYGRRFVEKISMGHFDPAVFASLVETIAQTIRDAYGLRVPVRAASGVARTDGLVKNRVDPDGLTDPELIVQAFYPNISQVPMAVLVSFAAHPTTLGHWNRWLSADYPGVVAREVERRQPGVVCLFLAGAVGDQAPVKWGIGYERAEWVGATLAHAVLEWLDRAHPTTPSGLHARQESLRLPPARVRLGRHGSLPRWISQRLVDDDATLTLLQLDEMTWLGVPCDLATELGQDLQRAARAQGLQPMVVGFVNDYIGYCVTEARYRTPTYEALMAFNGPQAGESIVERLIQMMDQIVTRDK